MNEGKKDRRDPIRTKKSKGLEISQPKPRNFVAKNMTTGGAGAHKDKKKSAKAGETKHKVAYAESLEFKLQFQLNELNLNFLKASPKPVAKPSAGVGYMSSFKQPSSDTSGEDISYDKDGRTYVLRRQGSGMVLLQNGKPVKTFNAPSKDVQAWLIDRGFVVSKTALTPDVEEDSVDERVGLQNPTGPLSKILSAQDRQGIITIKVQAPDGSAKSFSDSNPLLIQRWLDKYGLMLPREIKNKFAYGEDVEEASMLTPNVLGQYVQGAKQSRRQSQISAAGTQDPELRAQHAKKALSRSTGIDKAQGRIEKHRQAAVDQQRADADQALLDKYQGVDIAAELERLQGPLQRAQRDYQYGSSNVWKKGQAEYEQLLAQYKELKRVQQMMSQEGIEEGWFKNALAAGALAGAALTGAGHAQAADLSGYNTPYLQQVVKGELPRPMVSVDDARAELQARDQGKVQTTSGTPSQAGKGFSKEYLEKAADPNRFGRFLISVEKAQELLKQMGEGVAEGAAFGSRYAEQLAQEVFDHNPNIDDENQVLNLGYNIAKSDLGSRAQGIFRDEDFPSDFVSAYFWLKKQTPGVEEDAVADFLARGGQIQHGKLHKPRKAERWQGSSHIGTGKGGKAQNASGLGANTNPKSNKPVVTADINGSGENTGNEFELRGKLIRVISRKQGWDVSDLEHATTQELIKLYREMQGGVEENYEQELANKFNEAINKKS